MVLSADALPRRAAPMKFTEASVGRYKRLDLVQKPHLEILVENMERSMLMVNMSEAKAKLSKLVKQVESGEEGEIIIARNGKPAARLVRFDGKPCGKRLGVAKGRFEVPDSIDAENEEIMRLLDGAPS